jgi:hypothetical protein
MLRRRRKRGKGQPSRRRLPAEHDDLIRLAVLVQRELEVSLRGVSVVSGILRISGYVVATSGWPSRAAGRAA